MDLSYLQTRKSIFRKIIFLYLESIGYHEVKEKESVLSKKFSYNLNDYTIISCNLSDNISDNISFSNEIYIYKSKLWIPLNFVITDKYNFITLKNLDEQLEAIIRDTNNILVHTIYINIHPDITIQSFKKYNALRQLKRNILFSEQIEKWRESLWKPYGKLAYKGWIECQKT